MTDKSLRDILCVANKKFDDSNCYYFLKNEFESRFIQRFLKKFKEIINTKRDNDIKLNKHNLFLEINCSYTYKYKELLKDIKNLIVKRNNKYEVLYNNVITKLFTTLGGKSSNGIYSLENNVYINKNVRFTKKLFRSIPIDLHDIANFKWTFNDKINEQVELIVEEYRRDYEKIKLEYRSAIIEMRNPFISKYNFYFNLFKIIARIEHKFHIENFIILKRNTPKKRHDYIIEILEKRGSPMNISGDYFKLNKLNLDFIINENRVKSSCYCCNEIITFSFGKNGTID